MFDAHLKGHGISYTQHQKLAFFFAKQSFKAGFMACIHGIFPNFFSTGASDMHKRILPEYLEMLDNFQKTHEK